MRYVHFDMSRFRFQQWDDMIALSCYLRDTGLPPHFRADKLQIGYHAQEQCLVVSNGKQCLLFVDGVLEDANFGLAESA